MNATTLSMEIEMETKHTPGPWVKVRGELVGSNGKKVVEYSTPIPTDRPLTAGDVPLPVSIDCPECGLLHLDEGEWATRPHKTHQCQGCGHEWRPFPYATVGISRPAVTRPAEDDAGVGEAKTGWLRKAVLHLLPRWGMEGHEVPLPGVRGVPNKDHIDPRFSVHHYSGHDGNLTVALMIGRDHSQGGIWQEMDFTPEQAVQIAAAILSMPAVEHVAGPLVAALTPTPPVQLSEREQALEGALRSELEFILSITRNLAGDIDTLEAGFNKSQRTRTTERVMFEIRNRSATLVQCAGDALAALARTTGEG